MHKLALLAAVAALALAAAGGSQAATPRLDGTVGPGFTITLMMGGKKVSKLKAGAYTIVVNDKSGIHDFHLTGPGLNKVTDVGGTGVQTWKVTLKKGTYSYMCDPHASSMNGKFTVS